MPVQVKLKIHHDSEGSCIWWFTDIKFRTIRNSTCAASSLGSYAIPKHKTRIQSQCTETGQPNLWEFTTLLRHPADSTPGRAPPVSGTAVPRDILEMGCPARGQTPAPQKLGRACGHQVLTTPPSPGSLHLDFHPLHSTATPLPTVTSDHIVTKSKTSLAFLCPKFLLHVWQPGGSYILKTALPSLLALSSRISSFCDHSFVKSSSSSYP